MMYISKDSFIKEFAKRTKANYLSLSAGPYEVTQLINSMVGLLIIPEQKAYEKICDSLIDQQLLNKMKDPTCLKKYTYNLNYSWSHKRFRNIQTYDDNNKHTAKTGKVINKKGRLLPWSAETAEIIKVQL